MDPRDFIDKWDGATLSERASAQSHFNDLCRLLDIAPPAEADPRGTWFTFEKGVTKTTGTRGWADVWRKGCFAWEYKAPGSDLDAAFQQLLTYSVALENPPLLIVSDIARIRVHTNWTNTVQEVTEFRLDHLRDGAVRDRLRAAFTEPEAWKPRRTRRHLTEEAAEHFAALAQRLRARGHDGQSVAHFVNRLVFCLFAEDVTLLPGRYFQRLLEACERMPGDFTELARDLFAAMRRGGRVGVDRIDWFNGGLFDDDTTLPLERADIADLLDAARLDWSQIDPSILGTLFERGLDPDKRSQLGAHYTDRDKIMMIVEPVIIRPLMAEWAEARAAIAAALDKAAKAKSRAARTRAERAAAARREAFLDRLHAFRVLDPACGSGNFLYLALLALKDIEHRANLDAEAMGLPRGFPRIGPEAVRGIELNPYAAELARVSVWVGEIQWMRRNGFDAARNPILRPLDNIECRDAVLAPDGTRADWPDADVVIGNPPFLGNKKMIAELGEAYTTALRRAYAQVPGGADLVCYWFAKAWAMIAGGRAARAGLVATNSIRGGANRAVLKPIVEDGRIFEALSDESWTVEGAAVRVSLVCFDAGRGGPARLDGAEVAEVYSDLSASGGGVDLTRAARLPENLAKSFIGRQKDGPLDIHGDVARQMIVAPANPHGRSNTEIVRPWRNGMDVTRRPSDRWLIDFMDMEEHEAALFEAPFEYARVNVKPIRESNRDPKRKSHWWRPGRSGEDLRAGLRGLDRFVLTPRVSKFRLFVWTHHSINPDSATVAIARADDTTFGILHSRFHELWALRMGTSLEDRPRYTPSTTFETFPFPEGLTPDIPAADYADDPRAQAISGAAARLNGLREAWLNPPDLVDRVPEVVPGYPDRIVAKDEAAARKLKKRTLANLDNARPAWLDHAHRDLDRAVADAYGWGEDWRAGGLDDEAILARLFALNRRRAQSAAGASPGRSAAR